jgi:hypothetical protein
MCDNRVMSEFLKTVEIFRIPMVRLRLSPGLKIFGTRGVRPEYCSVLIGYDWVILVIAKVWETGCMS